MDYEVVIPKPVQKQLNKLPNDIRSQVLARVLSLAEEPRPIGVKKLKGFDHEYRLRIRDYRVRYEIDDQSRVVVILNCQHRRNIYRS